MLVRTSLLVQAYTEGHAGGVGGAMYGVTNPFASLDPTYQKNPTLAKRLFVCWIQGKTTSGFLVAGICFFL